MGEAIAALVVVGAITAFIFIISSLVNKDSNQHDKKNYRRNTQARDRFYDDELDYYHNQNESSSDTDVVLISNYESSTNNNSYDNYSFNDSPDTSCESDYEDSSDRNYDNGASYDYDDNSSYDSGSDDSYDDWDD